MLFVLVVIICVVEPLLRRFMLRAHKKGMTDGEYVYITANLLPSPNLATIWRNGQQDDPIARKAFQPLLQVNTLIYERAQYMLKK